MRWLFVLGLIGCGNCEIEAPLDYDDDANWLCRPGLDRACADELEVVTVGEDGGTSSSTLEADPDSDLACFVLYPTLDLRLTSTLHHKTKDVGRAEEWTHGYVAHLGRACQIWAPVYRQTSVGVFAGQQTDKKELCTESAYTDVLAAFDAFVAAEPDKGIVLYGHSQGGQHLSQLIRDRFETDESLASRLVAAYPIGWTIGTEEDALVGGSFDTFPLCEDQEHGCVVSYRSAVAGRNTPSDGRFLEGEVSVCVNPADADANSSVLKSFMIPATSTFLTDSVGADDDAILSYPGAFRARCTTSKGVRVLEVSWERADAPPIDLDNNFLTGINGSHNLDMNLGMADIADDILLRAESWRDN